MEVFFPTLTRKETLILVLCQVGYEYIYKSTETSSCIVPAILVPVLGGGKEEEEQVPG